MTENATRYDNEVGPMALAKRLSLDYPGKVFRVYKAPHRESLWVRQDIEPVTNIEGFSLEVLASFLDGELVRP